MSQEPDRKRKVRREWEEWYADAKAYYEIYGDLLVPTSYRTEKGVLLGRWIERQRAKYNGTKSMQGFLDSVQIDMLEKIGMVWKLENRFPWQTWMAAVKRYHKKYGNLEVPADFVDGDMALGNWIKEQRKRYHFGKLTDQCISDLNEYDMNWGSGQRRTWEEWYEVAGKYYEEHGDLMVPRGYKVDGHDLFEWVDYQRERYARKRPVNKPLSEEQIVRLEAIGMVWSLQEERNKYWDNMYTEVSAYCKKNGKLPIWPRGLCASNGRRMDYWIFGQKEALGLGRLSEDKIQRLADIGIYPYGKRVTTK